MHHAAQRNIAREHVIEREVWRLSRRSTRQPRLVAVIVPKPKAS